MAAPVGVSRWLRVLTLPLAFRLLRLAFRLLPFRWADRFIAEGLEPFPPIGRWVFRIQELACRAVEQGPPVWLGKPYQGRDGIASAPHVQHHRIDRVVFPGVELDREAIPLVDAPRRFGPIDAGQVLRDAPANLSGRAKGTDRFRVQHLSG